MTKLVLTIFHSRNNHDFFPTLQANATSFALRATDTDTDERHNAITQTAVRNTGETETAKTPTAHRPKLQTADTQTADKHIADTESADT